MAKDCTGKLTRSALGKVAFIGELYDARTEMFCSRSLFTSSFPKDFIKNQQNSKCTIEYSFSDQLSERFNLLKVEPELKLSILLGNFTLEGHGKYLQEGKKSERTVSCSLLYNFSTVCEKLMTAFNEIVPFIDNDVFEEEEYTHVVTEINWGANCTIILEHHNSDVSKEIEAKVALKAELVKFKLIVKPEVEAEGKGEYIDKTKTNHFDLKVYADVLPDEGIPNTVEKASEFISKLPELVKPLNDGKGKPLKYAMMPLAIFMKICNYNRTIPTTIRNIHETFIDDLVFFFEELAVLKQKLNDLQTDFSKYQKYVRSDCRNEIRKMLHKIKCNETRLKEDLAVNLPKARAGEIPVDDLIEKTEHYQTSDINLNDIETFINDFKPIRSKLNEINLYLQKGIIYLGKDEDLDSLMIENTNHDFFVLYTSEQLKKVNPVFTRKILNFFLSKEENFKVKHVVVDLDVNPIVAEEVDTLKISHYRNGFLISSNIYQDKISTLDQKKEEEDGKDLLNLAKLEYSLDMCFIFNKPVNSDVLKLPCPGYLYETCSKERLVWHCTVCKAVLEHCYDDHFYCKCGKAKSEAYELKCSSSNHGDKYLPVLPLRIELSNEECFTDKECLTNEECFDVPQGNHFEGEELF